MTTTVSRVSGSVDIPDVKPRTATVLGLLALTSLTFSYLGSYAVAGVLVDADVVRPWQPDADPRPRWLATSFCVLMLAFMFVGGAVRFLSARHLKQIDEMANESAATGPEPSLRDRLTP